MLAEYLLPAGLFFAFTPGQKVDITPQVLQAHQDLLAYSTQRILQGTLDTEGYDFLAGKINHIGLYFERRGFNADAAAMYAVGLRVQPNSADLHNNYGGMLLAQGQFPAALEQFNAAYNQDPSHPIVNRNLGLLLLKWGDETQAAYFFERALFLQPRQWDTAELLGETYLKLGRPLAAVHTLQLALTLYEQSSPQDRRALGGIYAQLGEAYIRLGRLPEATRALHSVLTSYEESTAQQVTDDSLQTVITWARETLYSLEQGLTKSLLPHPFLRQASSPADGTMSFRKE
jgi:tetratricopeptide (TPR) repeat protein